MLKRTETRMKSLQYLSASFTLMAIVVATSAAAFSLQPILRRTLKAHTSPLWDSEESHRSNEKIPQSSREASLEQACKKGSEQVAEMSLEERTKRAMLAEAVEDNISRMEVQLEGMMGENGAIPTDEETREQCVMLAKEIKLAQQNYEDLVTGGPSAMLNAIDSLNGKGENE